MQFEGKVKAKQSQLTQSCQAYGVGLPETIESECVFRKGKAVGYALRFHFIKTRAAVLACGAEIIQGLGGYGRLIHLLNHSSGDDEAVLEISFKF